MIGVFSTVLRNVLLFSNSSRHHFAGQPTAERALAARTATLSAVVIFVLGQPDYGLMSHICVTSGTQYPTSDKPSALRGRSLAGEPCGLSRHKARHSPEVSEPAEELRVPVPITKFSGADSDFPLASLRARVASERPWCVRCSPHASPTLGVGGVW
jgi:hypothetical protein